MDRFEAWCRAIFAAPVKKESSALDPGPWRTMPSAEAVDFMTRAFSSPRTVWRGFDEASIAQGLRLVIDPALGWAERLLEDELPWPARKRAIESIVTLFREQFGGAPSLPPPLASICYMFWDVFPTWGDPNDPDVAEVDRALLGCMESILRIDSTACQESALHGLNHWQTAYPEAVMAIIDAYLARHPKLDPELRQHAEWAKRGAMQ